MIKQLFLVRHADYVDESDNSDPGLSEYGEQQARKLAQKIKGQLLDAPIIWTSPAKRARETACILFKEISSNFIPEEEGFQEKAKLWADNDHCRDFRWLKEEIVKFTGEVLIIVSHLEYIQEFPRELDLPENFAGYAEGVKIENEECFPL